MIFVSVASPCPANWEEFQQSCYYFSNEYFTWQQARDECLILNANLVVINSEAENVSYSKTKHRKVFEYDNLTP